MKRGVVWLGLLAVLVHPSRPVVAKSVQEPGVVVPPSLISTPTPRFPPIAVRQGHEGVVILRIKLGPDGETREVSIAKSSGYDELDAAAQAAVATWQMRTATRDGKGIESTFTVPVTFDLNRGPKPGEPSFMCKYATTPTEKAICADPELSALDGSMGEAFLHKLVVMGLSKSKSLQKEQAAYRNHLETRCGADAPCIKEMTLARLRELGGALPDTGE